MTPASPSAPKGARALLSGLFGRKPASPPPPPVAEPRDKRIDDMQAWPWSAIHDAETERFGPLTWHAAGAQHEDWSVGLGSEGLRVNGNGDPHGSITLGGDIDRRWRMLRITAEIEIHALAADHGFIGFVAAETGDHQLLLGLVDHSELIVFKKHGFETELVGQCTVAAHASGDRAKISLQVILFDNSAVLFANDAYLVTLTDAAVIGPSASIGFHLKGQCDATLSRLTVEAVGAREA